MRIRKIKVEKIIVTNIPNHDPIEVIFEDIADGCGEITIKCATRNYSYYWGAMGKGCKIRDFIQKCDIHYLAGKLAPKMPLTTVDDDKLAETIKIRVIELRKEGELDKDEAREYFDNARFADDHSDPEVENVYNSLFGEEWWYNFPDEESKDYFRFKILMNHVREICKL